ncbi:Gibberellin-regulated protein 6 [Apostasia shenzhenica]|uniref:Gibberellin-regulated protein 6 n=1 Tax=Apostasia shenzhenica TaxID=1088818 RepID=A0A2H9ZV13_9ASPA|nr:Gibberellin-regulated protein 6 [Apostasia shenzhenica]
MAISGFLVLLTVAAFAIVVALNAGSMAFAKEADHSEDQYHPNKIAYGPGSLRNYQCPSQCSRRCSQTQYRKACLFFCNKCCNKCLCVPPGFYGNKGACPCYSNWKTKRGGPKCP